MGIDYNRIGGISSGGFGGPIVKATTIRGNFVVLDGGNGGWIINHKFIVGGGVYSLSQQQGIHTPYVVAGVQPELEMSYGGLELQYIHQWNRVAHVALQLLTGGGEVYYQGYKDANGLHDEFAVIEPGVGVEVNVTGWLRIVGGGSYRFIGGASIPAVTGRDLSGPAAMVSFKFGKF